MSSGHDEQLPRKRQRTDEREEGSSGKQELQRDKVVWYEDGNIVVRAGPGCAGEGAVYGFKCHQSILASRSKVFETMLQLPNSGGPAVDGIPTVDFPDPWEDVRDFLRMMYGALEIPPERRAQNSVSAIAGALRLAAKYDVPDMAQQLRRRLAYDYPNWFFDWVEVEDERYMLSHHRAEEQMLEDYPEMYFDINLCTPEPASVVRLVQDIRAGTALRAAWYELSRSYVHGRLPFKNPDTFPPPENWVERREADLALLEPRDMKRLLLGRERLRDMARRAISTIRVDGHFAEGGRPPCKSCKEQPEACLRRFMSSEDFWDLATDPMGGLLQLRREVKRYVCDQCKFSANDAIMSACLDIWESLVEIFELRDLGIELYIDPV
ncbi:hypothetical protein PsYK624_092580 [Phanerochaete sordida]|uniref:BTB domain-containing protein n=1 Tax=Phanerochaete sordida TaxID=48140 RepID=A0A9P3LFY1_9APHY|nr:hypothetical protein PsYK624_092580 [Phanerochaete sordida]